MFVWRSKYKVRLSHVKPLFVWQFALYSVDLVLIARWPRFLTGTYRTYSVDPNRLKDYLCGARQTQPWKLVLLLTSFCSVIKMTVDASHLAFELSYFNLGIFLALLFLTSHSLLWSHRHLTRHTLSIIKPCIFHSRGETDLSCLTPSTFYMSFYSAQKFICDLEPWRTMEECKTPMCVFSSDDH